MVRINTSVVRRKRRKKVLKQAKGQFGNRKCHFSQAKRSVIKGMAYSYRDRKVKKREFRSLWIVRINAACKEAGTTYSRFINGLMKLKVDLSRKVLADLAITAPDAFGKLVKMTQKG